jgi:hypothetical protein
MVFPALTPILKKLAINEVAMELKNMNAFTTKFSTNEVTF